MKNKQYTNLPDYRFNFFGVLVLFLGAFVPAIFVSFVNVIFMMIFNENYQYSSYFLIITNGLMWLGTIYAFDFLVCRPQTAQRLRFSYALPHYKTCLVIFPMMLGMMFISEFITAQIPTTGAVFGPLYEYFSEIMEQLTHDSVTMIVMAVIMAPIFEEIVFRGIIQKGLINNGMKVYKAILISALLFGLVHANPWQFIGGFFLGYVLGLVYYHTGSLLMPIWLHAFNNGCSALLIYYGGTESFADFFNISQYWLLILGIVMFLVFYYIFKKKNKINYH